MSTQFINTISKDSTPVYGFLGLGWLFPYWNQSDWIKWHKELTIAYGVDAANQRVILAMQEAPLVAECISYRNSLFSGNADFIEYAKAVGFYEALFTGILGTVMQIPSTANTVTKNVLQGFEDVSKYLIPIALIGTSIFLFLYLKKQKLI